MSSRLTLIWDSIVLIKGTFPGRGLHLGVAIPMNPASRSDGIRPAFPIERGRYGLLNPPVA